MRRLGGRIWDADGPREGVVHVDAAGQVQAIEDDVDPAVDVEGLVLPAPINAHTHLADRAIRGQAEGLPLDDAVAPPDGLKHRYLREADPTALEASFESGLEEVHLSGARHVIDFREQGPAGARLARSAAERVPVSVTVLGRPTEPGAWQAQAPELVDLVDGIGISGLADQPASVSEQQAAWCHTHGKTLALHHSEGEREDLDAALALDPDLLVHGTFFTEQDARRVAEAKVPLVLCPRSNALFGNRPPVARLLDAGVDLALGTDNAMFHTADVWQEARLLVETWPALDPWAVLGMVVGTSLPERDQTRVQPGEHVVVLDERQGLRRAITEGRVTVPWRENVARP